jgi:flagellar basal body-associated protein FliL
MSEKEDMQNETEVSPARKRRNVILGVILAAAALAMYLSIFFRLSENPLQ